MNTKIINGILIGVIAVVIAVIGFFAWQLLSSRTSSFFPEQKQIIDKEVDPIMNRGKESEDRDAMLERDVRTMHDAVIAYAKDHNGRYPESDLKNPCLGESYCLKGVDINEDSKIYLSPIPQIPPSFIDYHYRSDNQKKEFCISTPPLETEIGKVFQCTEERCGRFLFEDQCQ